MYFTWCYSSEEKLSMCFSALSVQKQKHWPMPSVLECLQLISLTELCIKFLLVSLPSYIYSPGIFDSVKTCCITGSLQLFFSLKTCFPQIYAWIILSYPSKFYSKLFIIVDLYEIVVTPNYTLYGISFAKYNLLPFM